MSRAVLLVPADVDAPTGGNVYDRRMAAELARLGWRVDLVRVPYGGADAAALDAALAGVPPGAVAVVDGLVGNRHPGVLAGHAGRVPLVSVVHLLLGDEPAAEHAVEHAVEARSIAAVDAVVVTSPASARRLAEAGMPARQVAVVVPGTDPAPRAPGTDRVSGWLCPAAVTPRKDQAGLLAALRLLPEIPWSCRCVGPLDRAPAYAADLAAAARSAGLAGRFVLAGARDDLAADYAAADLVVLPSRYETFGMVLTEALVRGIPVVSTTAGAIPETVGPGCGLLVPPGDPPALAAALRRWATQPGLRDRLRAAVAARPAPPTWPAQARELDWVLGRVLGRVARP